MAFLEAYAYCSQRAETLAVNCCYDPLTARENPIEQLATEGYIPRFPFLLSLSLP